MKKTLLVIGILACVAAPPAWAKSADPAGHTSGPARKLGRGVANVFTGLLEVPTQVGKIGEEEGSIPAATYGLGKGFLYAVGRTLVGVVEVVTFPFPNDSKQSYEPLIRPEFVTLRDADRW